VALNGETAEDTMTLAGDLGVTLMLNNQLEEADQMMNRLERSAGRGTQPDRRRHDLLNNIAVTQSTATTCRAPKSCCARSSTCASSPLDLPRRWRCRKTISARYCCGPGGRAKPYHCSMKLSRCHSVLPRPQPGHGTCLSDGGGGALDLEDVKTAEPFVQFAMDRARAAYGEKSLCTATA